jgi:hypothetical protein
MGRVWQNQTYTLYDDNGQPTSEVQCTVVRQRCDTGELTVKIKDSEEIRYFKPYTPKTTSNPFKLD